MNLLTARPQRTHFNPKNKAHVASLKQYLETGNWGEAKFVCEGTYLSVPDYVMRKYLAHQLKCRDIVLDGPIPTPNVEEAEEPVTAEPPMLLLAA